jgi:hypothetical protein
MDKRELLSLAQHQQEELETFLRSPGVADVFGQIEVAQLKSVIHDMQRYTHSAEELTNVNDTLIQFLNKFMGLKIYEKERRELVGGQGLAA